MTQRRNTQPPRAILLTFDRLSRRCLGCYGHEWIETPNFDRLASQSVVFDQHFVSPHLADSIQARPESYFRVAQSSDIESRIISEPIESADAEPRSLDETPFARLIAQADAELDRLAGNPDQSWFLWLKSAGINWQCLATAEFAELYADELETDDDSELDPLREAEVAYAAYVTQLDHLLGTFLKRIEHLFGDHPPMLIVAGLAGESLGEADPLPLAHVDTSSTEAGTGLRDEFVHTPLFIANSTGKSIGSRRQELVQFDDLDRTIAEWFGANEEDSSDVGRSLFPLLKNESVSWRNDILLIDELGAAIRTADRMLVEPDIHRLQDVGERTIEGDSDFASRLYWKPEDVWEMNDVAKQNPDVVALLQDLLIARLNAVS